MPLLLFMQMYSMTICQVTESMKSVDLFSVLLPKLQILQRSTTHSKSPIPLSNVMIKNLVRDAANAKPS